MSIDLLRPVAVPPGSGRVLEFLGVTHKLTGIQTGGAFYVCEAVFGPESGSPLHVHHNEDEVIHVLDGEIEFAGTGTLRAPVGMIHCETHPARLAESIETPLRIRSRPSGRAGKLLH